MYICEIAGGSSRPEHPIKRLSHRQRRWFKRSALRAIAVGTAMWALAAGATGADIDGVAKVTGPHVQDNLAVYFIHGPSRKGPVPLTLAEAMRGNSVTVHETGNVQQLLIENTGDQEVFVQAGDIVKGGRQDRVLTISLLIPPKSGKVSIGSYCVEHGRWSKRGAESDRRFASSETTVPSKAAKIAILSAKRSTGSSDGRHPSVQRPLQRNGAGVEAIASLRPRPRHAGEQSTRGFAQINGVGAPSQQQEVWRNVAEIQQKLSSNLATGVRSAVSRSSLQLSLEHQKLVEAQAKIAALLMPLGQKDTTIIGYAFAINGHINSAEIYPSNGLFLKMWPKLIRSSATEAIAERHSSSAAAKAPTSNAITSFLSDEREGPTEKAKIAAELTRERYQSKRALSLETRKSDGSYVHRSVLAH